MRILIYGVITLLGMGCLSAGAASTEERSAEERFFAANQAYRENRFAEAAEDYRHLIRDGWRSGELYYNLGNACLKMGRLGPAVLNYERARYWIPRDPDLNFNRRFARDQLVDIYPEPKTFSETVFFWLSAFSPGELFWLFAAVNGLFWGLVLLRFLSLQEWTYYLFLFILIVWIVTGLSFGLKWYSSRTDSRAVVLAPEADILAGPAKGDTVLFRLHEGSVLHVERTENDWALIHIPGDKRGWISLNRIERIQPRYARKPAPSNRPATPAKPDKEEI